MTALSLMVSCYIVANITWFAPSPLWNQVMRGGEGHLPELEGTTK